MPSPRWPIRVITSRSTTRRLDEEFAIAVAAENGRGHMGADAPALAHHKRGDVLAYCLMHCRVAHDAFLDSGSLDIGTLGLELRLDQRDEAGTRPQQLADRRQHQLERDEADIHDGKIRLFVEPRGIKHADVGLLHRYDLVACAQARMKLPAADIDCVNALSAACHQHLRKAAGGGTDVEANAAGTDAMTMMHSRARLIPAARHIRVLRR